MTPEQKRLVENTWKQMAASADAAAALFYCRLFEIDPTTRKLLPQTARAATRLGCGIPQLLTDIFAVRYAAHADFGTFSEGTHGHSDLEAGYHRRLVHGYQLDA